MPFKGACNPEELEMLRSVLAHYCHDHHIVNELDREDVAPHLLALFQSGAATVEALSQALADPKRQKRQA